MIFIQSFLCKGVSYYELQLAETQAGRKDKVGLWNGQNIC